MWFAKYLVLYYKILPNMKATLFVMTLAVTFVCASWTPSVSTVDNSVKEPAISKTVPVPSFDFFRLHRHGRNGAAAAWGLVSNNGVSGFVLQRTYEDPYDPYSEWADVCAMPCNGRQFRHTDAPLSPGFISYRVVAVDNGGVPLCVSAIETIQIVQH